MNDRQIEEVERLLSPDIDVSPEWARCKMKELVAEVRRRARVEVVDGPNGKRVTIFPPFDGWPSEVPIILYVGPADGWEEVPAPPATPCGCCGLLVGCRNVGDAR